MKKEDLMEKVAKLLEVGRRGGTQAEMETAMDMVHVLLAKHNLTLGEVEEASGAKNQDEPTIQDGLDGKVGQPWQDWIWNGIAQLYFCKMYSHRYYTQNGKSQKRIFLVGKPSNIVVVKNMAAYVIDLCFRLSKADGGDIYYQNSFKVGFGSKIYHRCLDEIQRAKRGNVVDQETSKALILHPLYAKRDKENEEWLSQNRIKLSTRRGGRTTTHDSAGQDAGISAANKVSLRGNTIGSGSSAVGRLN